jgi:ATP-binding cassette subfamily F protein 3
VVLYLGGYDSYLDKKRQENEDNEPVISDNAWKKKKSEVSKERQRKSELGRIESSIEALEKHISELEELLNTSAIGTDPELAEQHYNKKVDAEQELAELYAKWEAFTDDG